MHNIRKIESSEESDRKRKRNTLFLSVIMIGILVFSTAGYFSFKEDSETKAGENNVQDVGGEWILTYGDQSLRMSSSPESAQNTSVLMLKTIDDFYGKTVYVASDSDAASYEVSSTLGRYTERMQEACYGKCDSDLPEKDCNQTMIVIKTNLTEKGRVYEKDNCIFVEGDLTAVDAFLYRVFGVN
jgi:hypothetical protein